VRVQDSSCALNDQTMQIVRLNRFPKRFTKTVQEIENQRFFDLDFFLGSL
jgi:hypothetical protein